MFSKKHLSINILNAVILTGCGLEVDRSSYLKIVGGQKASSDGPVTRSTVALIDSASHQPFCSGTLISDDKVLTAAHCIDDRKAFLVGFGNEVKKLQKIKINDFRIHPQ